MKERADCHMETQRRSRKRLLGEEETVGGEKRQRLEEVVVSRSSDTRPHVMSQTVLLSPFSSL